MHFFRSSRESDANFVDYRKYKIKAFFCLSSNANFFGCQGNRIQKTFPCLSSKNQCKFLRLKGEMHIRNEIVWLQSVRGLLHYTVPL